MGRLDALFDLELEVDGYGLEPLEMVVASGYRRRTTVARLHGAGFSGVGEELAYDSDDQERFQAAGAHLLLAGRYTLATFSAKLDQLDLMTGPPSQPAYRAYRRWAFESAALDLALAQAGRTLPEVLGREPKPLRFVLSMGLGDPPSTRRLHRLMELRPEARFKLDAAPSWDDRLLAELASLSCVDVVDFKGAYKGTIVDQPADPALYRRVLAHLPGVWIEDPHGDPRVEALLDGQWSRVAWDAPIHALADLHQRVGRLGALNVKPSRIGTLTALGQIYDHAFAQGIPMYGGGQFELGPGRRQAQLFAALFHADAPNDLAPAVYHDAEPGPGAPASPVTLRVPERGLTPA